MAYNIHRIGDNNKVDRNEQVHPLITPNTGADPTASSSTRIRSGSTLSANSQEMDKRVRLRPRNGAESYVYGDSKEPGLLSILRHTNGFMFPTTPTINETHSVVYSTYTPSHSMAAFNTFSNVQNATIQVAGDFYVTNSTEALYVLACIHFIRSVTKMDFGRNSKNPGTPPPVLLFSGYGNFMYNDVPVIVKTASFTFESEIDYIQVPIDGVTPTMSRDITTLSKFFKELHDKNSRVWVPSHINISLSLEQQPTAEWLTTKFNLNDFKNGKLLTKGGLI